MIHLIDKSQINEEIVKNSQKLMILDVFAEWCMPCQMLAPILVELEKKYNEVEFYKVDADEAEEFLLLNNVTSIPTLLFYKDGQEVERIVGLESIDKISSIIEEYLK